MGSSKRWIEKTIEDAKTCDVKMPWERGARRADMIARRLEQTGTRVKVSLTPMPAYMTVAVAG